ncbi:MAG: DNA-processing protein DprA [Oscillospiraceae bacterium]
MSETTVPNPSQNDKLRYWVWLMLVFGAASQTLPRLLRRYRDPALLYDAVQNAQIRELTSQEREQAKKYSLNMAESIVYFCSRNQIELIPMDDERYPSLLRDIPLPPVLLTAQGNLELMETLTLTIVGARRPSPYSEKVVQTLVEQLAPCGFTIVSGFATGIDATSHSAALQYNMPTIAVLGCGINVNYPKENAALRNRMLSEGKGLILSEFLPGTQPIPPNFPKRNRILSGLSYGTVVAEASARSGSLVTANCALEQGKTVFCVPPHDVFDPRYAGVIPLLREGAMPLFDHHDVLYAYYLSMPHRIRLTDLEVPAAQSMIYGSDDSAMPKTKSFSAKTKQTTTEEAPVPDVSAPSQEKNSRPLPQSERERSIYTWLRDHGDTHVNDIADGLDLPLGDVLEDLMSLELEGYVESLFGKQYRAL